MYNLINKANKQCPAMKNQLTFVHAIFRYEKFYFVNALTSSSPKFVIIGNL